MDLSLVFNKQDAWIPVRIIYQDNKHMGNVVEKQQMDMQNAGSLLESINNKLLKSCIMSGYKYNQEVGW